MQGKSPSFKVPYVPGVSYYYSPEHYFCELIESTPDNKAEIIPPSAPATPLTRRPSFSVDAAKEDRRIFLTEHARLTKLIDIDPEKGKALKVRHTELIKERALTDERAKNLLLKELLDHFERENPELLKNIRITKRLTPLPTPAKGGAGAD